MIDQTYALSWQFKTPHSFCPQSGQWWLQDLYANLPFHFYGVPSANGCAIEYTHCLPPALVVPDDDRDHSPTAGAATAAKWAWHTESIYKQPPFMALARSPSTLERVCLLALCP